MKEIRVTLPIVKQHGVPVKVRLGLDYFVWETPKGMVYYTFNKWLLAALMFLLLVLIYFVKSKPEQITRVYNLVQKDGTFTDENGQHHDIAFPFAEFKNHETISNQKKPETNTNHLTLRNNFLNEKHQLIYNYKTTYQVNRVDQLPIEALLKMNKEISIRFIEKVLSMSKNKPAINFFSNTEELFKVETALMEQAKYQIPASIKLAQAALSTGFGDSVTGHNYFNIREKGKKDNEKIVLEFLTKEQIRKYEKFIISHEPTVHKSPELFACKIKQNFKKYYSPWASFRDHSLYLTETDRFAPLYNYYLK